MQAAGSLKKKRKRNLAKVTGLSQAKYNEEQDQFDFSDLYNNDVSSSRANSGYDRSSEDHIGISMSRFSASLGNGDEPNYYTGGRRHSRVTRDPMYASKDGGTSNMWSRPESSAGNETPPRSMTGEINHNRPVLISDYCIRRLTHIMALGLASFGFPWYLNRKTYRMERWTPFWERIWFVIWLVFAIQEFCLTLFQFYAFYTFAQLDEEGSYRPYFMNCFAALWYCYGFALNLTMHLYREKIRLYINHLFIINKKLVDEFLITTEGYTEGGQALLRISIHTNITQTFISCSLFLTFPFSPWYLYHYIYSEENPWYWLIPGLAQEFIFVGKLLANYLLIAWVTVAHANSVEFWLQEAHNHNDSGMTQDHLRQPGKAVEVYRALQVLTNIFNEAMSPMAIAVIKWINWTALIPCGYVLIRSLNEKFIRDFPGILTYPFGVIDCYTCSYAILQITAEMFDIAASFLNSWSQTKNKNLRRILVSCPVLKVKIGTFYSLTVSTTVTYFKSCFDYIIDSIITFK